MGATVHRRRKLIAVDDNAIVIGPEEQPKWIPREVILFVEANP